MSKKDLHYIGFLVNVDDSILNLELGDGFLINKKTQHEAMSLLEKIRFHYGTNSEHEILEFDPNGGSGDCYCVEKRFPSFVETTPQGGIVIPMAKLSNIHRDLGNKFKLLRLFKEGNIFIRFSLFYYFSESSPKIAQVGKEYPLADRTIFHLDEGEIVQSKNFIKRTKFPFKYPFLQLAFDSFELSYETYNRGLAFLSLMISMEAMFSGQRELRYRVSRNTAVLLGENERIANTVFKKMKTFYDKRSALAHGSKDQKDIKTEEIYELRDFVRESIKSIIELDVRRDELLERLNKSAFGQNLL